VPAIDYDFRLVNIRPSGSRAGDEGDCSRLEYITERIVEWNYD